MKKIKNIIFDLGGVLLDIDTGKTDKAFEKMGVKDFKNNYSLHKADKLFDDLERGKISEPRFFDGIRNISKLPLENDDIREAWNALILDFRTETLQCIGQLKKRYKLYLLSNTNSIHYTAFHRLFTVRTGGQNFDDHFTKAYYSHLTGFRKPEKEIYELLLSDAGIVADESLFIDDLLKNTEAAATLGIQTHLLLPNERIEGLNL